MTIIEVIRSLMLSPFYFEIELRERLRMIKFILSAYYYERYKGGIKYE